LIGIVKESVFFGGKGVVRWTLAIYRDLEGNVFDGLWAMILHMHIQIEVDLLAWNAENGGFNPGGHP
jgi:hypothetical protein